jgi:SAM-dependent methyltransferase
MRKTFRSKNNYEYWRERWIDINADEPMVNQNYYPLKYSNMVISDKDQIILEAGCGAGRILRYYHENNYNIFGIDFIAEAIKKLKKVDPSLKAEVGNILNLDFKNDYFDVVLAFGLYHNFHSEKLHKSISETFRVLKQGGKLCASFRADNIQELIVDWIRKDNKNKHQEFHKLNLSKKEFSKLFEDNGFSVENIFSVQNMPFLYKFKFFRSTDHKVFDENKARLEGYKLSSFGQLIQKILLRFFPDNFCNIYLMIATKK